MQLVVRNEYVRGQHADEQSSRGPSGRNRQVEGRQVPWSRFERRALPVRDHAQEEEGRKVAEYLPRERWSAGAPHEQETDERQRYFGGKHADFPRVPAI